jgi:lysophospholipase L1-like esterase
LLVGVLLALLATELLLRIGSAWFFPPLYVLDAALGWRQAAELERTLLDEQGRAIHFATDARGLRATPFPDARTPGRPRVLVVGDSFVQASQVDAAESFVGRLGATLAPAEVWNVGVGGYSTVQELLALPVQLAAWAPDVVLWVVYENDFVDNLMPYFSGLGPRPHAVVDGSDVAIVASPSAEPFLPFLLPLPGALWLYEHCALYRTLHKNLYLPAAGSALAVREQRERSRWPVALQRQVMGALLAQLRQAVGREGRRLLLAAIPSREDAQRAVAESHDWLRAWSAAAGVPFVSLLGPLASQAEAAYFPVDIHLTAAGHAAVAAALAPRVQELLPQ